MTEPLTEPRLEDPDTWPSWPILRLIRFNDEDSLKYPEDAYMVDIESFHHWVFLLDGIRFYAAVNDPDYPLSNLPHKEYPSTSAILADGWSPTF